VAIGLLLLAGLWLLLVGLLWWALARLWPGRSRYAQRSAQSLMGLAALLLIAAFGLNFLTPASTPVRVPVPAVEVELEPLLVELTITTDPEGALIYLQGEYIGQSPLTASVTAGQVSYVVVADPSLYRPFAGQVTVGEERNLAVWIDRRVSGELSELLRIRENSFLTILEASLSEGVIRGVVRNDSSHHYPAVFISYLLYQGGALVGATHALVPELAAGEARAFATLPVGEGVTRYLLLELVELVPLSSSAFQGLSD